MIQTLTNTSLLLIVYTLFGYPLLLWIISLAYRRRLNPQHSTARRFSIIVAARNEEAHLVKKLENCFSLARDGISDVEIIVASDASDDNTDKIALEHAPHGVRLVRSNVNGGKEAVQAQAIAAARGEILVFTDAKVELPKNALVDFCRYFSDPSVGAVSSTDQVTGAEASGEGAYVRYEMKLRELESKVCSLVGLSGSCFAIRRELASDWKTGIPSDFFSVLLCWRAGKRAVLAPEICGSYAAVKAGGAEFSRKVRTVLRGMSAMRVFPDTLNPFRYGFCALELLSHKILRWLMPVFLLCSFVGLYLLSLTHWVYSLLYTCAVLLLLCAIIGALYPPSRAQRIIRFAYFFLLSELASLCALGQFIMGKSVASWTPSKKG